jgi:hypothetical protein
MSDASDQTEVRAASDELHSYLSDQLPPLIVADSISLLAKHPPELTGRVIHSWATTQRGRGIPVSDYLYHAMIKLYLFKEYNLIPPNELFPFLIRLKRIILEFCPPEDRDLLQRNLQNVEVSRGPEPSQIQVVFRQDGSGKSAPAESPRVAETEGDSRLGLLLRRLERQLATSVAQSTPQNLARQELLVADGIAEAARAAKQSEEVNTVLDRLRQLGINASMDNVFRILAKRLPAWSLPDLPDTQVPVNKNLQAMQKIITTAKSVQETGVRFRQLVIAAVERFNQGSLQQAASMMQLAEKIIASKSVEPGIVEISRATGDNNIDEEKLRKFAENPDLHATLRQFLAFFNSLSPAGLIESLAKESKRERRKLLLLLLECHGPSARTAALEILRVPPVKELSEQDRYVRRNLLYLLRKIPPAEDESVEELARIVKPHVSLEMPDIILKEAFAYFPQIKHESVERHLSQMLSECESLLLNPQNSPYEAREIVPSLDRVTAALCRIGTATARKAVMDHVFRKKSEFGNAMSRLAEIGKSDLSADPTTLNRLLEGIRSNLPLKMFGVVLQQRDWNIKCMIEALSGTTTAEVRALLEDLSRQHPNRQTGKAAVKALASLGQSAVPKRAPQENVVLMGDMEIFGLPGLLQNFSQARVSGTLVLKNRNAENFATIMLEKGMLRSCRYGPLSGEIAFYQILEKPQPGTFHFSKSVVEETAPNDGGSRELLGLLLEAMRRYDEVEDAAALIPDDASLKVLQQQPLPLPDEKDGLFFRNLWAEVTKGASPQKCDEVLAVDSYRVRRLLVHWLRLGIIEAA